MRITEYALILEKDTRPLSKLVQVHRRLLQDIGLFNYCLN